MNLIESVKTQSLQVFYQAQKEVSSIENILKTEYDKNDVLKQELKEQEIKFNNLEIQYNLQINDLKNELNELKKFKAYHDMLLSYK